MSYLVALGMGILIGIVIVTVLALLFDHQGGAHSVNAPVEAQVIRPDVGVYVNGQIIRPGDIVAIYTSNN